MSTVVAIHQPNFFPWLGYFDKILKSDIFVFMDDVQFPMTSKGSWINRVKIIISSQEKWFTCPIKRDKSKMLIKDVSIFEESNWREKFIRTLELNYKRTPYYSCFYQTIKKLILYPEHNLSRFNINCVLEFCRMLGIDNTRFVIQSELHTSKKSTELLIEIVRKVGGDTYLCGGGASGYQDDSLFNKNGINLRYQNFIHPKYSQIHSNEFISGLSVLDCIFNIGIKNLKKILMKNG